jgi:hypothetical protein
MPFTIVTQGTFTQPSTNSGGAINQIIPLPSGADYFKTINLTQMSLATPTGVVAGEWFGGGLTPVNDGLRWTKAGSNVISIDKFSNTTASNGFTYVTSLPAPQAALTGTTITNTSPAVASVVNTYSNGDQVVIDNSVGAQMYSGMTFTISSVSGSGFTLLGLNTPGSAASAFTVRRVNQFAPVEPSFLFVTAITQAAQAQVTVSQANSVYLGQKLEFTIPGSFGMVQLNNFNQSQAKPPVVTQIIDAYNFLINVNTTNYTAFAFPLTSLSPTAQLFATVAPAGQSTQFNPITGVQTGYNFNQIPFHSGVMLPYMYIPSGVNSPGGVAGAGAALGDVIIWQAWKAETGTINAPVPS